MLFKNLKKRLTQSLICLSMGFASLSADLIVSVTENTTSGGTNWAFSGASGILGTEGQSHFLVGATAANPQAFQAGNDNDTSVTVLSGTNHFNIYRIFSHNYGALTGSNGAISNGLDFQTTSGNLDGADLSLLNGLVLHADAISISSLNAGTYTMNSYYSGSSGYYTSLGNFTLNVGDDFAPQPVPEPSTYALMVLGLVGLGVYRRRKK